MGIEGTWYNELKSIMTIQVNNGVLSGTYESKVGDAAGIYALTGAIDVIGLNGSHVVGWVVRWSNDKKQVAAITAWSGEYQTTDQGKEVISTEWLLTSATKIEADWASTLVGHDLFTRTPPTPEAVAERSKIRAWSHP
jgi:hypothetical protein